MKKIQAILTKTNSVSDLNVDSWFESIKNNSIVYFSTQPQFIKLRLENLKGNICIENFIIGQDTCRVLENHNLDYFPEEAFYHSLELAKANAKSYRSKQVQENNSSKEIIAVFDHESSIADSTYNEWFESIKDNSVIKFSTNIQFLKLQLEHVNSNINVKYFDFFGNQISILNNGDLQGNIKPLTEISFNLAKEFVKTQKEKNK